MQTVQCCLLLNNYTFAGWVTGSLYNNVTWIFFWSLANHKYDLCSYDAWILNKPGKSFMQPMKVCLPWLKTTDATHNCMPGCQRILAVTASWLIFVCGFCLCGIRRWKSHIWWILEMKGLTNLLHRCWVGRTDQSLDLGGHMIWPY
jgi:hypothetical protein